jgi:NADH-quinone oxidoreductase subunit K
VEPIVLGAILFALGLIGFLARRNLIVMFLSTEVMLLGVVLTAAAYSGWRHQVDGQVFGLTLLVIAAVEAGLALGLIVLLFRRRGSLDTEAWAEMRG